MEVLGSEGYYLFSASDTNLNYYGPGIQGHGDMLLQGNTNLTLSGGFLHRSAFRVPTKLSHSHEIYNEVDQDIGSGFCRYSTEDWNLEARLYKLGSLNDLQEMPMDLSLSKEKKASTSLRCVKFSKSYIIFLWQNASFI